MLDWPKSTTISDLCGFIISLTGYCRKFVKNHGILAKPLTNLLKKGSFQWNKDVKLAFIGFKQVMTSTPTLALLNFTEPFTIEVNALRKGIVVVLTQRGKPITYMSCALGASQLSWSTYAKKMLVVVVAIQT